MSLSTSFSSRRNFLSRSMTVAGSTLITASAGAQQLSASSSRALSGPVHGTYLQIALKHMQKLSVDPLHNPFITGDLALAYRMHAQDLETLGLHRQMKADLLDAGIAPIVRGEHVDSAFRTFAKFGIRFPDSQAAAMKNSIVESNRFAGQRLVQALRTDDLIHFQRGIHGAMLEQQAIFLRKVKAGVALTNAPYHRSQPTFTLASHRDGSAHLQRVNDDETSVTVVAGPDGWPEIVVPYNPGIGLFSPWAPSQGTLQVDRNLLASIFAPIQTSGGQTVQPCTIYYACLAALSSVSSTLLANLSPADAVSVELWLAGLGIGITLAELVPALALVGITLGLLAVVC